MNSNSEDSEAKKTNNLIVSFPNRVHFNHKHMTITSKPTKTTKLNYLISSDKQCVAISEGSNFFYLGFVSQIFTIHRTAGEAGWCVLPSKKLWVISLFCKAFCSFFFLYTVIVLAQNAFLKTIIKNI